MIILVGNWKINDVGDIKLKIMIYKTTIVARARCYIIILSPKVGLGGEYNKKPHLRSSAFHISRHDFPNYYRRNVVVRKYIYIYIYLRV